MFCIEKLHFIEILLLQVPSSSFYRNGHGPVEQIISEGVIFAATYGAVRAFWTGICDDTIDY